MAETPVTIGNREGAGSQCVWEGRVRFWAGLVLSGREPGPRSDHRTRFGSNSVRVRVRVRERVRL